MPTERLPPRSILIVDNDKASAEEFARQLRKMGHDVELAFDGPNALEVEQTFRPDMVIIDLGLQGMDAYTVARFIQAQPGRDVMLVSSGGSAEDAPRAKEVGFTDHLSKYHGAVFLPSLGMKLAEESAADYVREQLVMAQNVSAAVTSAAAQRELRFCQKQEFVLRMLEAGASRFDPAEMASLIPDEFLSEIRRLADSLESDLANYLAGYKNSIICDKRRTHIVNGASRWLRFFNP